MRDRVEVLGKCVNVKQKRGQVAERQEKAAAPDFWNDPKAAEAFLKETAGLKFWVDGYDKAMSAVDDLDVLYEFAKEAAGAKSAEDETVETEEEKELGQAYADAVKQIEELELRNMLGEEGDSLGAVLTINSGAGGTEANDWSAMLMRMYLRWAERNGYKTTVTDLLEGEDAGIKSATIQVEGDYAFGYLKAESGVHRLVRISPFNAQGKRQTTFSSVFVYPLVDDSIEIEINPGDLEWDTYRSSGAGGQHINKTSSAVRLIHKPTGIVVSCQTQRSQFQNRDYAMEMLKAKLYQIAQQQHMDKIEDIKGVQNEIAWGHQIRSYVFMPYTMVKDHRTNFESGNVQAVMDGDLDGFIYAYLKASSRGELEEV